MCELPFLFGAKIGGKVLASGFYNLDCMLGMAQFPNKYFELAIVDPPYGIGASKPSKKPDSVKQRNGSRLKVAQSNYGRKDWDNEAPCKAYFDELKRVSRHQIIWGANYFGIEPGAGIIVWDKLNGESDQFGCEIASCSLNRRTDIVHFMWCGMIQGVYCGVDANRAMSQQGNKSLNEHRIHPTQKPVALYRWLLSNYAKPGDKILDTHVGSASSLIACHQMGFEYWGFELDTDYYNAATERLNKAKAQVSMTELVQPILMQQIFIGGE